MLFISPSSKRLKRLPAPAYVGQTYLDGLNGPKKKNRIIIYNNRTVFNCRFALFFWGWLARPATQYDVIQYDMI